MPIPNLGVKTARFQPFAWLRDVQAAELSNAAWSVAAALFLMQHNGVITVASRERIAKGASISPRKAAAGLAELHRHGLLAIKHRRGSQGQLANGYRLVRPSA